MIDQEEEGRRKEAGEGIIDNELNVLKTESRE